MSGARGLASLSRVALFGTALLAAAGIACALVACKPAAKELAGALPASPVTVTVATVLAGPIAATLEVSGTVKPLEQVKIMPDVAGRVAKALLKEGDTVKAGQIIFLLDPNPVASSQSEAGGAAKRLAKKSAKIRSPLAGVMLARFSNPDDQVTAAPPTVMALVADIDLVKLTALIPEGRLAEVRVGQEITVTTDALAGRGYGGRVALVSPVADANAKSAQVEILVENLDHTLKPGMFTRARVFTAYKPRTILVPPSALIDGRVTVAEGGVARVRTVQTGIRAEEATEILAGVSPGDLVVVSGNKGLSDGARINYQTP